MGPITASRQYYNGCIVPQSPAPTCGGSSSFHAEAVSQSPSPGSSWSAQHHSVPRMPEGYYDYEYPGYEGQGNNVSHMAPGAYPSKEYDDDYDSQMESPTFSDTEWHDNGAPQMPHHSFFDDAYYDFENDSVESRNFSNTEREYDGDLEILPQSMTNNNWQDHNDSQMPPQAPYDDGWDDFIDADMWSQHSSDTEREYFRDSQMPPQASNNERHYSVNPRGQEQFDHRLGSQEQDRRESDDQGQVHARAGPRMYGFRDWSAEEEEQAKLKWAGGLDYPEIAKEMNTGRTASAVNYKLRHLKDWTLWSKQLDQQALELHDKREDWAQISNLLPGVRRSQEEIEARVTHLKEVRDHGKQPQKSHGKYRFRSEDDRHIQLGAAVGKGVTAMARDAPSGISRKLIASRASQISAFWTDEDDYLLLSQVGEYDGEVDWDYVGEAYDPPRDGEVVKTRWEYIRNRPLKRGS